MENRENSEPDIVAVKRDKPSSRFHGKVHLISASMIKEKDDSGRVVVHWPKKGKGKKAEVWEGTLEATTKEECAEPKG